MVKGGGAMPAEYNVAWWNLEDLFDEENAPDRRTEKVLRDDQQRHRGLDAAAT